MTRILLLSVSTLFMCSALHLNAQTLNQWQRATVKITSLTSDGFDEVGTGVVISRSSQTYWIVTAAHVVATGGVPHENLQIYYFDNPLLSFAGELIQVDEERDLALLRVAGVPDQKIQEPVTIYIKKFELREPVTAIGHPLSNDWNVNISSQISEPSHARDNWRFGVTPTGFGSGSSGGPVISNDYKWLGLITEVNSIKGSAVHIEEILKILKLWKAETNLIHVPFEFLNEEDIPAYLFVDDVDVPELKKVPDGNVEYVYLELEEKILKEKDTTIVYNFQDGELTEPEKKRIKDGKKLRKEIRVGPVASFFASQAITAEQFRDFLNAVRHRLKFSVYEDESVMNLTYRRVNKYFKKVTINLDSIWLGRVLDFESGNVNYENDRWFQPYWYPGLEVDRNKFRKNTNITEIEAGESFELRAKPYDLMREGSVTMNGVQAYCDWLNTLQAGGYTDWRPLTFLELVYIHQLEGQKINWRDYSGTLEGTNSYFDRTNGFSILGVWSFHPRIGRGPVNTINW